MYTYAERFGISILFFFLKMHKNVNVENKMPSLGFYWVIKVAIIAEKKIISRYEFLFSNAGCLYYPIKPQRLNTCNRDSHSRSKRAW
jgi:hypothetical protein